MFEESGGRGKPRHAAVKVCWGDDEAAARRTAHRLWANEHLPGELAQELPTRRHFEQASALGTEEMVPRRWSAANDVERHVQRLQQYVDAG